MICILEHELRKLMALAGLPEPMAVEPVAGTRLGGREVAWSEFLCRRMAAGGRRAAYDRGYGFRVDFQELVQGPVALGCRAHVGMGMSMSGDKFGIGADHGS